MTIQNGGRMKPQDKPLVYVTIGDVVQFDPFFRRLPLSRENRPGVIGLVFDIEPRYGHDDEGRRKRPLLHYVDQASCRTNSDGSVDWQTGRMLKGDPSFVQRVVQRRAILQPPYFNLFKSMHGLYSEPDRNAYIPLPRGQMEGVLFGLVLDVLGGMRRELSRPVDLDKVYALFHKQRSGLLWRDPEFPSYVRVRTRPFKKWVHRNAERFLATTAELHAEADAEARANTAPRVIEAWGTPIGTQLGNVGHGKLSGDSFRLFDSAIIALGEDEGDRPAMG
jgi:hypothetical protein